MIHRRRPRRQANHERWLVSYADFVTLLFALFVVMFATAQVDQRKVGRLTVAIQQAFQDLGVFPDAKKPPSADTSQPLLPEALLAIESAKRNVELARTASASQATQDTSAEDADLSILQTEVQHALREEIDLREVTVHRETEGLVISLRDFGFFDSGSANIKVSSLPALDRIASLLAIRTYRIRIEGHTDNVPIHTAQIHSNWELSTGRTTELVHLLIVRHHFGPERLAAAGYAEYHPIASNDTADGRAQNRRVDVVILAEAPGMSP
jgi:chemotaxis protein MotB